MQGFDLYFLVVVNVLLLQEYFFHHIFSWFMTVTNYCKFCIYLLGDVYIQPTQDTKNPVIYGVFSVSGWVTDSFPKLSNFHAVEGVFWFPPAVCIRFHSAWSCQLSLILKCCVAYGLSDLGYKDKAGCESGAQRESRSSEGLTEPIVAHRSGLIASCHSTHSIKTQGNRRDM